jgi:hypothetical protein
MELFAVFKSGVYRHECFGIYSTSEAAVERAKEVAAADIDDHHDYEVWPYTLDAPCTDSDIVLFNSRMVFSCKKSST